MIIIGYTSGVYDLFHIGHINILKSAKNMCDKLIVGVSIDQLVKYKNKSPVIPFEERIEIVRSCQYVDVAVPQESLDKMDAYYRYKFDLMFVGDDWYKNKSWQDRETKFKKEGVKIIYFPYTKTTSSTLINQTLIELRTRPISND